MRRKWALLLVVLVATFGFLARPTLTLAAPEFKILYSFCSPGCASGAWPLGGLIWDSAGNIYGITSVGGVTGGVCGQNGCGTVFELSPDPSGTWTERALYEFDPSLDNAVGPSGTLIRDADGNLYGTTDSGGAYNAGSVFELSPQADGMWIEKLLYSFGSSLSDGAYPDSGVIRDEAGNLYGTTPFGGGVDKGCGEDGCGTVFELMPAPDGIWTEVLLHVFTNDGSDGVLPNAGLTFDAAGKLYGTTALGGPANPVCSYAGCGTVYELMPITGGWEESVLHRFGEGKDGREPGGNLISDTAGNLYGTTEFGGNSSGCNGNGCGTVFELLPSASGSWTEVVLHSFRGGADGAYVGPDLTFNAKGKLFGVTSQGGAYGQGTVFGLTRGTTGAWQKNILYSFTGGTDGTDPYSQIIFDNHGNFYSTAKFGGINGGGVFFEITR